MASLRAIVSLLGAGALLLAGTACEEKKTAAQLNLEKQKTWQVAQKARAAKYYQELIDKYPDSPFTAEAKGKLQALGPIPGTPKPGGSGNTAKQ